MLTQIITSCCYLATLVTSLQIVLLCFVSVLSREILISNLALCSPCFQIVPSSPGRLFIMLKYFIAYDLWNSKRLRWNYWGGLRSTWLKSQTWRVCSASFDSVSQCDSKLVQLWCGLQQSDYWYDTPNDQISLFCNMLLSICQRLTECRNIYHSKHHGNLKMILHKSIPGFAMITIMILLALLGIEQFGLWVRQDCALIIVSLV